MKKLGYYILYAVFLVLLLYFGSQIYQYLRVLTGRTYNPIPMATFVSIYPIIMGLYLAIPNFVLKVKGQGSWTIDWIKLVTIGAVSLLLALAPILYFLTPMGQQAPQLMAWLNNFNQAVTISGVIFGYLVLSTPQRK